MISKKAAIIYIVTANKQHRVSRRCDHTTIAQATAGTVKSTSRVDHNIIRLDSDTAHVSV
jgi:hypothetical protein